jgi:hypothetical protein
VNPGVNRLQVRSDGHHHDGVAEGYGHCPRAQHNRPVDDHLDVMQAYRKMATPTVNGEKR